MPVVLQLLHEGVDDRRRLVVTPLAGEAAVMAEVRHRGAGRLGGVRAGESPLVEVPIGELRRIDRLLEEARRGRVGFDTLDDRNEPARRFLRLRSDPTDASVVIRAVDTREGCSLAGDWADARGAVTITAWDWAELRSLLDSWAAHERGQDEGKVVRLRPRTGRRRARARGQ